MKNKHPNIPAIAVVGFSNSGKTTLLEKLIRALSPMYRIGVIKHDAHDFEIDHEGKDTWRMREAGADTVVISGERKLAIQKRLDSPRRVEELIRQYCPDCDLCFVEGYKESDLAKILLLNRGDDMEMELMQSLSSVLCVVTDLRFDGVGVSVFRRDDVEGIHEVILDFMRRNR